MSEECNCPTSRLVPEDNPLWPIEKKIRGVEARRERLILELVAVEGAISNLRGFLEQERQKESPIVQPGPQGLVTP